MVATAGNDESCDDPPPGWIGIVTMVSEPSDPLQPTKTLAPDISLQIPMAKRRHPFQTPTPTSAYMLFVVFLFLLLSCHQTLTRLPPTLRLQSTPVPPTSSTLAATSTSPMKSTPTQIPYSPPLTPKMPHLLRCFRCRLPHPSLPLTLLASSPPSLGPVAPPAIKTLALTNGTTHPILLVLSISRSQTLASSSPSSIATLTSSESLFTALGFFSPKSTQNPNSNTAFFTSKSIKLSILFRNPFPSPVNFLISPFSHLPPSFLHLLKICVQIAKAILTLHSVVAKRYRILELSSSSSILSPDSFDTANSISDCYFSKSHDSLFLAAIADGSVQLYDLLDSSLLQPPNPVNGYRSPNPPSSHRRCLQRRHGHRGLKKPPPRRSSQSPETLSLTSVSEGSPHPLSPSPWARNASTTPTGLRWTQSRSTLTTKGKPHSLLPLSLNLISPTLSSTSGAAESNRYVFGASSSPISNSTASTSNSPPRVRSNSSSVSTDLGSSIWKQISARRVFHEIPQRDSASLTAMVFCYTDNGNMSASRKLSDQMLVEEINFWSALILCCSDSGLWKDSLRLCCEMLPQHVKPNLASLSILMFANIELGNSLVNRYAKCGGAPEVYLVFTDFPLKDVVSYNVMIPGFTSHGHGQEALKLFSEMLKVGICPDTITFLGMLYACNQVRNLELVQYYYNHMKEDYGVEPFVDHYACMVDLYGRTGSIDKAYDLVKTMPVKHHAKVWGALLKACSIHSHVGISEMLITSIFGHNEDGGIQENCINLVGRIANRGAEIVPVREWMRICFELPEMLKAHQKGIRSVTVTTTRFRKGTRSHQPSSCINLVPIRRLL